MDTYTTNLLIKLCITTCVVPKIWLALILWVGTYYMDSQTARKVSTDEMLLDKDGTKSAA